MAIKTYNRWDNVKLSKNIALSEFRCTGSSCGCTTVKVDTDLIDILQNIRDHFDNEIIINKPHSGYRCPRHNIEVGGSSGSYHVKGMAADFHIDGVAHSEVAKYAESLGVKGIGLYSWGCHVDTRTSKYFWKGSEQVPVNTFGGAVNKPTDDSAYTLDKFISDVQNALGTNLTGVNLLNKTVTLSRWVNRRHKLVEPVQKRLNALGCDAGEADGIAGAKFTVAVRKFQQKNGCVADGVISARKKTWKKLLGLE